MIWCDGHLPARRSKSPILPTVKKWPKVQQSKVAENDRPIFYFTATLEATWYRVLVGSRRSEKLLADDVNDCENHLRAKSQDLWHSDTRRAARLIPSTGFCFKNPGDRIRHLALKLSAGGFNRQTLSYLQECS